MVTFHPVPITSHIILGVETHTEIRHEVAGVGRNRDFCGVLAYGIMCRIIFNTNRFHSIYR